MSEVLGWMANAIASDGVLYDIRQVAEREAAGCNSWTRDMALEILALLDTQGARVDRLRAKHGMPSVAEATTGDE